MLQSNRNILRPGIELIRLLAILPALLPTLAAAGLDLRALPAGTGVRVETGFDGTPDAHGVLRQYTVELPPFQQAVYYAPFQKYDSAGAGRDTWPDAANRVQPLVMRDLGSVVNGGVLLLLKLADNRFAAFLPIAGNRTLAWFTSADGRFVLNLGTLGTGAVKGDLPLVAWARSADPYEAYRKVWEAALENPLVRESTRLREQKAYPEPLRYLGWCSWEEYHAKINEQILLKAVDTIEASGLPIRWLLVDDGHLDEEQRQLLSFQPNAKLPNGWGPLLSRRTPEKIRWMGVWLNFNGYWSGISPKNKLGSLNEDLALVSGGRRKLKEGTLQPRLGFEHSFAFYDGMIGAARKAGFDFVKVDNQALNVDLYRGSEQPVQAAVENARALEAATALHMDGLINCMAHNALNVFNTRISDVSRASEDYLHGNLPHARRHLHNSYGNIPWIGQTVWGDHDMFHSDDPVAGRMMAVSKAMSGGPVYLSDNPASLVAERIWPLCYRDGELLRPLAPAAPLPESLFIDPFAESKPFRAVAPLENESAAIVVYNLTEPEKPVTGYVTPADYEQANGMMQPRRAWKAPGEGLVLYDWYAHTAQPLREKHSFPMEKFSDRLFLLCPLRNGWAAIGRTDKFLSPAAVKVLASSPAELVLLVHEAGPLAVWQADAGAAVHSNDCTFRKVSGNLWQAELPAGKRDVLVRVRASRGR